MKTFTASRSKMTRLATEISRADLRMAARALKIKTSNKRERRRAAAILSACGASKGGQTRARKLSPEQRREIARKGGLARQQKARDERAALVA